MQQSYLDYAMIVIISRAIPDARDGLKPVQRKYSTPCTIWESVRFDYKKSARIVGEVLENIIHTAIRLSMMPWRDWHRILPFVIPGGWSGKFRQC
jgi:hypothetical protein